MPPDKKSDANPAAIALGLIGFLAAISLGWFMFGGPQRADLRSYFLAPPSAPQINIPSSGGNATIKGSSTTPPTYPNYPTDAPPQN